MELGHYYNTKTTNLDGIMRTIKICRKNSGQEAFLHQHEFGEECTPECKLVIQKED